jgi:hypothetical protein
MAVVLLATLLDVKAVLTELQRNADHDAFLHFLIRAFSGTGDPLQPGGAEHYCDRIFSAGTYTEYWSSDGMSRQVAVKAYPISSITNVWIDVERVFGDSAKLPPNDYVADQRGGPWIRLKFTHFPQGVEHIKATYVGGLATTTSTMPHDLRLACVMQVVHWFKNRERMGLVSEGFQGGQIAVFSPATYLPQVKDLLNPYRRVV